MSALKWETPPEDGRRRTDHWQDAAAELKKNPNQWAVVHEKTSPSIATSIKRALYTAFAPAGSFEATARKNPDGKTYRIYARYIGA